MSYPAGRVDPRFAAAVTRLAERLYLKMEHLDPTGAADWGLLTERERDFYRLCVVSLFQDAENARCVFSGCVDNNTVD